jgi:hypothetical protein
MADNATWPGWTGPADYEPDDERHAPPLVCGVFSATSGPVAQRIAEWRAREADN